MSNKSIKKEICENYLLVNRSDKMGTLNEMINGGN